MSVDKITYRISRCLQYSSQSVVKRSANGLSFSDMRLEANHNSRHLNDYPPCSTSVRKRSKMDKERFQTIHKCWLYCDVFLQHSLKSGRSKTHSRKKTYSTQSCNIEQFGKMMLEISAKYPTNWTNDNYLYTWCFLTDCTKTGS